MSEDYETYETVTGHANGAAHNDDDMPSRMVPDLSDPEVFVTELSAATPVFESQAVARIRVGAKVMAFKIRSVPHATLLAAERQVRPAKMPRLWDKRKNDWVPDQEHPAFLDYVTSYGYIKVVLGLADMTLRDRHNTIVWQARGEIQDLPAAITALRDMGITPGHVETLSQAIDALSQVEAEQDVASFLPRSNGA